MIENIGEFIKKFKEADKEKVPDFSKCVRPLDMALWVLWVAKDEVSEKRLTGEQIALVIIETQEISANTGSIINSLNRASDKVHRYKVNDEVYFEIMKPGRDYLLSLWKSDLINAFYFEPDNKFTAKKLLRNQIFSNLKGNLKIVDPYCSERTLDILESIKGTKINFITRIENLRDRDRSRFLRELTDFKSENVIAEFRNYPHSDIHDRYIISENEVTLIGHSIKDFGSKETFAIVLNGDNNKDIYQTLRNNFDDRWKISSII